MLNGAAVPCPESSDLAGEPVTAIDRAFAAAEETQLNFLWASVLVVCDLDPALGGFADQVWPVCSGSVAELCAAIRVATTAG